MRICVYGAASAALDQKYLSDAYRLGEAIAQQQIGLVYGGGATGMMGAVAEGVYAHQGEIIGVSPEFFNSDGRLFANCTQMLYTENMRQRKQKMEDLADAFIVTAGGIGTFDEFFEMLTLKQLGRHHKPIAILNTAGYFDGLIAFLEHGIREKFMQPAFRELFFVSDCITEVLQYVCTVPADAPADVTRYKAVDKREGEK